MMFVRLSKSPIKATYHLSYFLFRPSVCTLDITNPDFYGNVVYKLRKIMDHGNFSYSFTKTIKCFINRL